MLKFLPYTFPTWIELNPMVNTYPTLEILFIFYSVSVFATKDGIWYLAGL